MKIKQFEYKPLAHYSYAIISEGEIAIIDPERDPSQYYAYAETHNAKITTVIETHPHADFVSSHVQIANETGATIYNSEKLGAEYSYKAFDDGDTITLGAVTLTAINTPGHSPDSITIIATEGENTALFTGDTLFVGDVGRPDLREEAGNMKAKREELAEMMYHTMQTKFDGLPDDALVYPAHGAGSLCGKGMSDANRSTLGNERVSNWAFKQLSKQEFVDHLLDGQPFIPSYFGYDVDLNKAGATHVDKSISTIQFSPLKAAEGLIVDMRDEKEFKKRHLAGSYNIQGVSDNAKFETWLGSIIEPEESYTLVVNDHSEVNKMLHRVAKIGYETQLKEVITLPTNSLSTMDELDLSHFKNHQKEYTIVDIRNQSEIDEQKFFEDALEHPLNDLRTTGTGIPTHLPIVVHCAGGYRSAAGSSILQQMLPSAKVYDLSDAINKFK